jgi:hypothetical protein
MFAKNYLRRGSAVSFSERNVSGRRRYAVFIRTKKKRDKTPLRFLLLFVTFSLQKEKVSKKHTSMKK